MLKKCYILNGKIINIGEWDYQKSIDEQGEEVIGNPLPENIVEEEREFEYDEDFGWFEKGKAQMSIRKRLEMLENIIVELKGDAVNVK